MLEAFLVGIIDAFLLRKTMQFCSGVDRQGPGAVDQGGQASDPMDAALVPLFRRQRCAAPASCPRPQSRQLPRTLATLEPINDCSLTSLKEKLIEMGAKVVSHDLYKVFQMAEVAIPRNLFADILRLIGELPPPPVTSTG